MDLLIPRLGRGARGSEGSVKLRQNPRNFPQGRVFSWLQEGLKKGWECLKAWPDPITGSWQGKDAQHHPKGQTGVGFQLQGPGGEAAPKIPPPSRVSSSGIGSSAGSGDVSRTAEATRGWGHQDVTHRDWGGMAGVKREEGKARIAWNFGWIHP